MATRSVWGAAACISCGRLMDSCMLLGQQNECKAEWGVAAYGSTLFTLSDKCDMTRLLVEGLVNLAASQS